MKAIWILYYYGFQFNSKIIKDDEPHATTVFTMNFCESLIVNGILQFIWAKSFCSYLKLWPMIGVLFLLMCINYFLFIRTGLGKKLAKSGPPIFINFQYTKTFAIFFYIIANSMLFWEPILIKNILSSC